MLLPSEEHFLGVTPEARGIARDTQPPVPIAATHGIVVMRGPDKGLSYRAEVEAELKKAQQAWIVFRDADCGALTAHEWGHGTGMGAATESCLLEKTIQRTGDLEHRYIDRR